MSNSFKKKHSFEERKAESKKIMAKYDDRIPVIVHKDPKSKLSSDPGKIFPDITISLDPAKNTKLGFTISKFVNIEIRVYDSKCQQFSLIY